MIEAAIDTIAEVGFGRASLARIGERIGISKGLIGYHFAGKDDLIEQVVLRSSNKARPICGLASSRPWKLAPGSYAPTSSPTSPTCGSTATRWWPSLRLNAAVSPLTARSRFHVRADAIDEAVQVLGGHLAHYQAIGDLRPDFDPNVMAVAIRAATDAVLQRYIRDPDLDVENYASEIVTVFDLATRTQDTT